MSVDHRDRISLAGWLFRAATEDERYRRTDYGQANLNALNYVDHEFFESILISQTMARCTKFEIERARTEEALFLLGIGLGHLGPDRFQMSKKAGIQFLHLGRHRRGQVLLFAEVVLQVEELHWALVEMD